MQIPLGISVAAAVRVGNNLGANNPSQAKLVMKLSIALTRKYRRQPIANKDFPNKITPLLLKLFITVFPKCF
jgi:hypothetical protein